MFSFLGAFKRVHEGILLLNQIFFKNHSIKFTKLVRSAFPKSIVSLSRSSKPLEPVVSMIYLGLLCFWEMQPCMIRS